MESYSCNIAVGGDRGMIVRKGGLSVPELVLLRFIHGESSVEEIEETGTMDASQATREHLSEIYGGDKVQAVFGPYGDLPKKISEASIEETFLLNLRTKADGLRRRLQLRKLQQKLKSKKNPHQLKNNGQRNYVR